MSKMIIAVDIGNTTTSFGFFNKDNLVFKFSLPSSSRTTPEKCWKKFQRFSDSEMKIEGLICSSVSPEMTHVVKSFSAKYLKTQFKLFKVADDIGIKNCYDKPEQLGADRLINALAAKKIYSLPAILIDLGTAITIDLINEESEFLGGVILPGVGISADSLHKMTSMLPKVELIVPDNVLGRNTTDAIQSGLTYGFSGMIRFLVEKIKEENGIEPKEVIVAGGHSSIAEQLLADLVTVVDPNLTLKGLNCAFRLL